MRQTCSTATQQGHQRDGTAHEWRSTVTAFDPWSIFRHPVSDDFLLLFGRLLPRGLKQKRMITCSNVTVNWLGTGLAAAALALHPWGAPRMGLAAECGQHCLVVGEELERRVFRGHPPHRTSSSGGGPGPPPLGAPAYTGGGMWSSLPGGRRGTGTASLPRSPAAGRPRRRSSSRQAPGWRTRSQGSNWPEVGASGPPNR